MPGLRPVTGDRPGRPRKLAKFRLNRIVVAASTPASSCRPRKSRRYDASPRGCRHEAGMTGECEHPAKSKSAVTLPWSRLVGQEDPSCRTTPDGIIHPDMTSAARPRLSGWRGTTALSPPARWWAWQGLNLRPLRCQHSALPLSYTPTLARATRPLPSPHRGRNPVTAGRQTRAARLRTNLKLAETLPLEEAVDLHHQVAQVEGLGEDAGVGDGLAGLERYCCEAGYEHHA